MINFNGDLMPRSDAKAPAANRAFLYGDAIFDTLRFTNDRFVYLEDHYFRLMSSMRMLRMRIPMNFTLEHYQKELLRAVQANSLTQARVRITIYRSGQGKYSPRSNQVEYLIDAEPLKMNEVSDYEVELFKDHTISSDFLSTIKTTNRIINVLAGLFADENGYDNCLLINEKKQVVEAVNANIFLIKGNEIHTPGLDSGCINGIVRKKIIEALKNDGELNVIEKEISPFDLLKADEVFLTNSIMGLQIVTKYRKKHYNTQIGNRIKQMVEM